MLVLAVDTSTSVVTVALHDEYTLIAGRAHRCEQAHSELLAPAIHDLLAHVDRDAITHVVAGVGPGPFTGLRVGIATAAVLAHTWGVPAFGVCSLDAMAHGVTGTVLSDARRREVYAASYVDGIRQGEPVVGTFEGLQLSGPYFGERTALARYVNIDVANDRAMTAEGLGRVAVDAVTLGALPLTPLYLRRPDAQEPATLRKSVLGAQ